MDFVDKFISGIIYFSLAVFLLPTLKSKLSVKLLWDVGIIFLNLFVADITFVGQFFDFMKMWITNSAPKRLSVPDNLHERRSYLCDSILSCDLVLGFHEKQL